MIAADSSRWDYCAETVLIPATGGIMGILRKVKVKYRGWINIDHHRIDEKNDAAPASRDSPDLIQRSKLWRGLIGAW